MGDEPYVLSLRECGAASSRLVGGKAAAIGRLLAWRLPCPAGYCVTTVAHDEHLWGLPQQEQAKQLEPSSIVRDREDLAAKELSRVRQAILAMPVAPDVRQEIAGAWARLAQEAEYAPLQTAVRSSAVAEDSACTSFAGQYDTFLNVRGVDAALDAIRRCWASVWSARAHEYALRCELDPWAAGMAVIVQELIPAEASGTLFTANPVTGRLDEELIEAHWGLGEQVASGRATPDAYYVSPRARGFRIDAKCVADKWSMVVPAAPPRLGTVEVAVPVERVGAQVLEDEKILELAEWGNLVTGNAGGPVEMEWALCDARLVVIQSRPLLVRQAL